VQEGQQCHHHQQRLQPLARQDGEGADEGGGRTGSGPLQQLPGLGKQRVSLVRQCLDLDTGGRARQRAAVGAHGGFDATAQRAVARVQARLVGLDSVQVGRQRELHGILHVTLAVGGDAGSQLGACQR